MIISQGNERITTIIGGKRMSENTNERNYIKETLTKQLELLAECSEGVDIDELAMLSTAMAEIAHTLERMSNKPSFQNTIESKNLKDNAFNEEVSRNSLLPNQSIEFEYNGREYLVPTNNIFIKASIAEAYLLSEFGDSDDVVKIGKLLQISQSY